MAFLFSFDCDSPADRANYSPEVVLLAAVREDDFSREPPRIIRGKKCRHTRDVLRLADAAQRRTRDYLLLNSVPMTPAACAPSVSVPPGLRALTRIFLGPNSFESTRVKPLTALFDAT